ncbi:MAG: hypothetical protein PHN82_10135 [bacterium]|nr:hypothetical protein [bacterium]
MEIGAAGTLILLSCRLATGVPAPARGGAAAAAGAELRARAAIDSMTEGIRLFREGRPRGAAAQFEKVLRLDPSNRSAAEYMERCRRSIAPAGAGGGE